MFWQEDEDKTIPYQVPDDVQDLSFAITCKKLPLDHAWDLSQAIQQVLPWFADEPLAGIHTIHVADSGNGWERPDDPNSQFLLPSRRTRMVLRLPKQRLAAAQTLCGKTLDIGGHPLTVGEAKTKSLTNTPAVFARYVLSAPEESEPAFLQRMADAIRQLAGVKVKKMLCGKSHAISTPEGSLYTRHLMIADLDNDPSIKLQQHGLGGGRKLGCGIFLPHKSIKALKPME